MDDDDRMDGVMVERRLRMNVGRWEVNEGRKEVFKTVVGFLC